MIYERDLEAGLIVDAAARLMSTFDRAAAEPARAMLARWEQIAPAHQGTGTQRQQAADLIDEIDSGAYARACDRRAEVVQLKIEADQAAAQLKAIKQARRQRKREIRDIVTAMLDSGEKVTQKQLRAAAGCNGWELSSALKYYKRIRGIAYG